MPGWTGHSLYLEVELLEGGHQVSGALNPWRVGAVVGEQTTIAAERSTWREYSDALRRVRECSH